MRRCLWAGTITCGALTALLLLTPNRHRFFESSASAQSSGPVEPTVGASVGPWKHEFKLRAWGTRSEGEWGIPSFNGKEMTPETLPGVGVNDYVHTPWGTLYWHGVSKFNWGQHGCPICSTPTAGRFHSSDHSCKPMAR
jgi:hypothetical protein